MQQPTRFMTYDRNLASAVTFEIDSTKYVVKRQEFTLLDWIASLGGLASLLYTCAWSLAFIMDSPQMFVVSDMLQFHSNSENQAFGPDHTETVQ